MTASTQNINGKYVIYIRYKDDNGKWQTQTVPTHLPVNGRNKRKAEQFRIETLTKFNEEMRRTSGLYVTDLFYSWLTDIQKTVQPDTFRGYKSNMDTRIIPYFEERKLKLSDLKPYHLEEYYKYLIDEGVSAQTVKHHHQNISSALKLAIKRELITVNPAQLAETPKVTKYVVNFLTPGQMSEVAALFNDSEIRIPVFLAIHLGLRRSEILGLTWKNVDFDKRQVRISQTVIQNTGGDYVRIGTKSESSNRALPISENLCAILHEHKLHQEEQRKRLKHKYHPSDFVCTFEDGTLISPNYFSSNFRKIIDNSDLPHIRLHDLRHSLASSFFNNGFTAVDVQHWLGHSSPSTTLNFYLHNNVDQAKIRMCNALDSLVEISKPVINSLKPEEETIICKK